MCVLCATVLCAFVADGLGCAQCHVDIGLQIAMGVIFLIARYLHMVAYVMKLQPWRTIFYMVGVRLVLRRRAAARHV